MAKKIEHISKSSGNIYTGNQYDGEEDLKEILDLIHPYSARIKNRSYHAKIAITDKLYKLFDIQCLNNESIEVSPAVAERFLELSLRNIFIKKHGFKKGDSIETNNHQGIFVDVSKTFCYKIEKDPTKNYRWIDPLKVEEHLQKTKSS